MAKAMERTQAALKKQALLISALLSICSVAFVLLVMENVAYWKLALIMGICIMLVCSIVTLSICGGSRHYRERTGR